jgi:predicted metal-dependent hydrolase
MSETLRIADLDFEIRRSNRRKTLGLTVDRAGELVVHAPTEAGEADLARWVESRLLWVHRKLLLKEEQAGPAQCLDFVSGESISYLGRAYRLKVVEQQREGLHLEGEWFRLRSCAPEQAVRRFRHWFIETGTPWLERRVGMWQRKTGPEPAGIVIGDLGYHWGSCGRDGTIRFNWCLLQLPVPLVDYIIVHELTHLAEKNHSSRFWRTLERALPDWKARKDELETSWGNHASLGSANLEQGVLSYR